MTTVTLTPSSSSPWNVPAGVTSVRIQCWGEGGNGGGGGTGGPSGGGGGGGEYAEETTLAVPSGGTAAFTIGGGGTGTDTSFTGSSATVTAHHGGNASSSTAGAAGTGSANGIHHDGGAGAAGQAFIPKGGSGGGSSGGTAAAGANGTAGSAGTGGAGGTAPSGGGNGGAGGNSGASGTAGSAPGGAGGGGGSSTSTTGGAGAAGQITLTYTTSTSHSGTATLSGTGTLTATGAFAGTAALSGSGTLTWSGSRILKATVLSGSGTLTGTRVGIKAQSAALTGTGTLAATAKATYFRAAALTGAGTLAVPGFTLGVAIALSGTGSLTIIGTGGTVQASAGPSNPSAWPGTSQVAVAPPGSGSWQYLGTLGLVTSLTYSFTCPGGADKLTATVMIPASYRTSLLNPGWQVRVTRGGHIVWTGRMDEPVPSASGWQVTAVGDGQRGQDFRAMFTSTWPSGEPDQAVNNAISRGLPWVNPGIGSPAGAWLGQAQDPASATVTDLLNLVTSRGGLTWYVNSQPGGQPGSDLTVFPLPTTVNRLLVCTQPVPRTLGGDVNTIFLRYQVSDASSSTSGSQQATFGTTTVQNAASVAAHGVTETYVDLSGTGVMSAGAAQTVGNYVLSVYQRASFAGPFTVSYGQLLNAGGVPVDPGADQAGTVCRLILTDFAFGGEVSPAPITFLVGSYEWNDFAQVATVTPYQTLNQSLSGLLSLENTLLAPVTVQQ
jgi:hypothetical protein